MFKYPDADSVGMALEVQYSVNIQNNINMFMQDSSFYMHTSKLHFLMIENPQ